MKYISIVALLISTSQSTMIRSKFIDDSGITVAESAEMVAKNLNSHWVEDIPGSRLKQAVGIKNQDPDVSARLGMYKWDTVAPHAEKHHKCGKKPEQKTMGIAFPVNKFGYTPGETTRTLPEIYTGFGDNFMGDMILNYAIEGGKVQGAPNG